jgi:hypothetical protein
MFDIECATKTYIPHLYYYNMARKKDRKTGKIRKKKHEGIITLLTRQLSESSRQKYAKKLKKAI